MLINLKIWNQQPIVRHRECRSDPRHIPVTYSDGPQYRNTIYFFDWSV